MKTMSEGMKQHLQQGALKLAMCWKIQRQDGQIFRFTDHDQDLWNGGVQYAAETGFSRSTIANKTDMSVDNTDLQGLLKSTQIDPNDIRAGRFDGAEIWIFLVNYESAEDVTATLSSGDNDVIWTAGPKKARLTNPTGSWRAKGFRAGQTITVTKDSGDENVGDFTIVSIISDPFQDDTLTLAETVETITAGDYAIDTSKNGDGMGIIRQRRGTIGKIEVRGDQYEAEIRGMTQTLTRPMGRVTSPRCGVDLFSTKCGLDYTSFKVSTTVYTVVDNRTITLVDGQLTEATGYYDGGVVKWTGGANDGLSMEVESWNVDTDTLVLFMPMPFDIAVNDPFDIIPGCMKRYTEDCITKYDNGVNFRGFPHIPGFDKLMETPDARQV